MKTIALIGAVVLAASVATSALAYVTPTDAQIEAILADHGQLNAALQGASPAQAAETVVRTLAELVSSPLPASSKQQNAALLYVRALLLSGENAPSLVESLAGQVDKELLSVFAASTAIAVGSNEGPVFASLLKAAGDQSGAVAGAAADPLSALGPDLVAMIQQLVIELRGVAAPVIPPPATAPLSLIPPIVPRGPTAPPVASTYVNQ